MSKINWFPGHMKKTLEQVQSILKLIDVVIILLDARAPLSTLNPELIKIINNKPRIYLLNKADLADKKITNLWLDYFKKQNHHALAVNATKFKNSDLINTINDITKDKVLRQQSKGIITRPIRVAIVGIPNVGKSTLINTIAKRKAMKVENRAGVTKALKWIKLASNLELLDTPGVLWPKFEDEAIATKIAMLGGIKETILPLDLLASKIIEFMTNHHLAKLSSYFKIEFKKTTNPNAVQQALELIARKRGLLTKNNQINQTSVESLVVRAFQNGSFGPISLEQPNQYGK